MSVEVIFTKGFGNNLFQYTFARLLAEHHNVPLFHKSIYNIPEHPVNLVREDIVYVKTDWHRSDEETKQFYTTLFKQKRHFVLKDYFEDFTLYLPHEQIIQSWFPTISISNKDDLVIHFRAGDALLYRNNQINFPTVEEWKDVIDKIPFKQLYVVTDAKLFTPVSENDIENTIINICHKRGYQNRDKFVNNQEGQEITNKYINLFNGYNCIWMHHTNFMEDFNFLRQFDKVLIGPSTFGWWAVFLSRATHKYVYRPWRKGKGIRNKNLGKIPWNHWGHWGH